MKFLHSISAAIIQRGLALFRFFGLDLFKIWTESCIRRKLHAAMPADGRLRTDGIGLMLDIPFSMSLAQVGRDFIDKLSKTDIPFCVLDTNNPRTYQARLPFEEIERFQKLTRKPFDQRNVIQFTTSAPVADNAFSMGMTPFWEFQSGMMEVQPSFFDGFRHAVVFSGFCYDYFRKAAPKDVAIHWIRYPFPLERHVFDRAAVREKFGIPKQAFVAFYNFDLRSCFERKNPLALIEAFTRAFAKEPSTMLVMKISGEELLPSKKQSILDKAQALGILDRLRLVSGYLTRDDVFQLTACTDVYASLHRGEGLGLGMLEAMAVGVPVIATAYGGNMDFTQNETAFLVPFKMVKPETDFKTYAKVVEWPEPDVDVAAGHLRVLYDHPELGRSKAAAALAFIEDYYSLENFEKCVREVVRQWREPQ